MGLKTHLPQKNRRDHETRATLAKLWWNLGGTFRRTFNSTRICPREPQRVRKQFCSARERNHWSRKLLLLGEFTEKSSRRDKDYFNTPLTCCSTSINKINTYEVGCFACRLVRRWQLDAGYPKKPKTAANWCNVIATCVQFTLGIAATSDGL